MGSFKQHFDWAQGFLLIALVFIIFLLTAYAKSPIVEWLGENTSSVGLFPGIMTATILYLVGSVAPDIDLDTSKISKKTKIIAPFILGTAIGAITYVTIGKVFNDIFTYDISTTRMITVAVISAVIGYFITYAIVWSPWWKKLNLHWGMWHSVTAGAIVSIILGLFFFYTWQALWGFVLGISFFLGYLTHLVCDQVYHDIRDKEWAEGKQRYAFKTLRNGWSWDPLILLNRFGPIQILGEYLSKDGEGVAKVFNNNKKKNN